jgi:nicotinamide riboside kinase
MQKTQMQAALKLKSEIVFFDTWLVITQIWLKMVYNDVPEWIPEMIKTTPIDLFLICDTDIPWEPDPVRENGGEMRIELSKIYQKTIEGYGYPFMIVKGEGENRTKNAIDLLNNFLQ